MTPAGAWTILSLSDGKQVMVMRCWGIDLGGTKIEGVILSSPDDPEPLCRIRIDTEANRGYQHIVGRTRVLIERMTAEHGEPPGTIGIGTPGALDARHSSMKNCNTTCLNGKPLKVDLHQALGLEVILANDANCFALAEARFGAGRGAQNVFGVILGTGVGGGIVINNKTIEGAQGIAGEWGHNLLIEDGEQCYCGKTGCTETVISGPSLERYYAGRTGSQLSLATIAERHSGGQDPDAAATIERLVHYFGKAIAVVINILDPEIIVLGGGVSNLDVLYQQAQPYIENYVFNSYLGTRILKHQLGDSAGVFGAALLPASV